MFLFFPKWLHTPRWLAVRRRRRLRRLERYLAEQDEKRKKQRQKQKRKRREQKRKERASAATNSASANTNDASQGNLQGVNGVDRKPSPDEDEEDAEAKDADGSDDDFDEPDDVVENGAVPEDDILGELPPNGHLTHDSDRDSSDINDQFDDIHALPSGKEELEKPEEPVKSKKKVTIVDDKPAPEETDEVLSEGSSGAGGKKKRTGTKLGRQLRGESSHGTLTWALPNTSCFVIAWLVNDIK